jgi:hypothetical protein
VLGLTVTVAVPLAAQACTTVGALSASGVTRGEGSTDPLAGPIPAESAEATAGRPWRSLAVGKSVAGSCNPVDSRCAASVTNAASLLQRLASTCLYADGSPRRAPAGGHTVLARPDEARGLRFRAESGRSRPGGMPSPRPGAACRHGPRRRRRGSRAAEGRSAGPRSALDAVGERRGIRRLAATTAGPRTGAGSPAAAPKARPFWPVSCPGEAGQRTASADRVCAADGWSLVLLDELSGLVLLSSDCWCCCWSLVLLLVLRGWPVSLAVSARRLAVLEHLAESACRVGRRW